LPYLNNSINISQKEKEKANKVIYNRLLFPVIYHSGLIFTNCNQVMAKSTSTAFLQRFNCTYILSRINVAFSQGLMYGHYTRIYLIVRHYN